MHILTRLRSVLAVPASAALAAALAGALALCAPAAPAAAHDALEGSAPASGEALPAAPSEIRLDFNNRPLGVGVEVRVTDASGATWSEGSPEVVDRSVRQPLRPGAPAGGYTVVWRVVSSDSHPIEGTFGFTVAEGSTTPVGSPAATASPGVSGPAIQTPEPGATATPAPTPSAPSQDIPWLIVVFALVAVALLAALGWGARKRLGAGGDS
ncbi:copper resistance CopC family protein [Sinomonas mesophila]|uniref:copper resistance CopC family protein n=1 Tax=Sinomonas mesophila TaxID=1531955 RepID=UPI000985C7C2|nr:copper resistance CopC family protein [Sinomonas mesophila]